MITDPQPTSSTNFSLYIYYLKCCIKKIIKKSICDMWYVTWKVTRGEHRVKNVVSLALTVWELWFFEDLEGKDEWINEWLNEWMTKLGYTWSGKNPAYGRYQLSLVSFVTIWVFDFCHNQSFWVLSQFEFLIFDTIWVLNLVTIWVFEFCHNLSFWH